MMILFWENQTAGLSKTELIECLAKNETPGPIPQDLQKTYGNFGYRYTLSRTFDEVMALLIKQHWVKKNKNTKFRLTPAGINELKTRIKADKAGYYQIAAYGVITANDLLARLS
jgi:hypothetical protein